MAAQPWRLTRYLILALVVAIAGLGALGIQGAKAAPAGAAQNLQVYNQQCVGAGKVLVSVSWSPSNLGTQWADVSRSSQFAGFTNQGPLASNAYYIGWTLDSNITYFTRIATFTAQGLRTSDTLQFQTINCGVNFSPPQIVDVDVFVNSVRIDWTAGTNNFFYCVDTAFTLANLLNITGSWHNWGCGTTNTVLDLNNLACGREHFARVWAAGPGTSDYSQVVNFVSQACNFSAPSNPNATVLSATSVQITWTKGANNIFSCIDFATSQQDLLNLDDSWFNAACGTTGNSATVSGLDCGTTYFYRIWGTSPSQSGYSGVDSFTTGACAFNPPTNLDEDILGNNDVRFEWTNQSTVSQACVDIAETQGDLTSFEDTFMNACNGAVDEITVGTANFECGETYFWRVFARGPGGQGYSVIRSFEYDHASCP